jgi:hypothetical protein
MAFQAGVTVKDNVGFAKLSEVSNHVNEVAPSLGSMTGKTMNENNQVLWRDYSIKSDCTRAAFWKVHNMVVRHRLKCFQLR